MSTTRQNTHGLQAGVKPALGDGLGAFSPKHVGAPALELLFALLPHPHSLVPCRGAFPGKTGYPQLQTHNVALIFSPAPPPQAQRIPPASLPPVPCQRPSGVAGTRERVAGGCSTCNDTSFSPLNSFRRGTRLAEAPGHPLELRTPSGEDELEAGPGSSPGFQCRLPCKHN